MNSISDSVGVDAPNPALRLYYHPVSTTSRPITMFAVEHALPLDLRVVDLFSGEQRGAAFSAVNPNQAVPVLEHGGFRLTESSAILKYLADLVGSHAYPAALQARARVNEAMDWFQTGLSRELAYGLAYPQLFPPYRRDTVDAQAAVLAWSLPRARRLLTILDQEMLGPNQLYMVGDRISLADYLGLGIVTVGEAAGLDYADWPHLRRWLSAMRQRPAYAATHAAFHAAFGPARPRPAAAPVGG